MDDELQAKLRARMNRPAGLAAAREFLQAYVYDSDMAQLETVVRHMLRVNPVTVLDGMDGLDEVPSRAQAPDTYAKLVAVDANRDLDEHSDASASNG